MDHRDHVALLGAAVAPASGQDTTDDRQAASAGGTTSGRPVWADIGAGDGAFTLALADLLGPGSRIIAVDRDAAALRANARAVEGRFPGVEHEALLGDLTQELGLPPLDGLVAANSLHFVARDQQVAVVRRLAAHLRPGGAFVVVEYDADHGNPWVPDPFTFRTWQRMAEAAGLVGTREIGRVPSRFLGAIYAAESRRPDAG